MNNDISELILFVAVIIMTIYFLSIIYHELKQKGQKEVFKKEDDENQKMQENEIIVKSMPEQKKITETEAKEKNYMESKIKFIKNHINHEYRLQAIEGFYEILFNKDKYPEHFNYKSLSNYPIEVIDAVYEIIEGDLTGNEADVIEKKQFEKMANKKLNSLGFSKELREQIESAYHTCSSDTVVSNFKRLDPNKPLAELTKQEMLTLVDNHDKATIEWYNELDQIRKEEKKSKKRYLKKQKKAEKKRIQDAKNQKEFDERKVLGQNIIQTSYGVISSEDKDSNLPGVYAILNTKTYEFYIGSSKSMLKRKNNHLYLLKAKEHHSYKLQELFNQYEEKDFKFYCLEYVKELPDLKATEQKYLNLYKPKLNVEIDASSRSYLDRNNIRY